MLINSFIYGQPADPVVPDIADVMLLLHMDGSNGSTTFTDSSPAARAATRYGNTQISTAQAKYGGASGYFDGTGDYLTFADNDAWAFGSGDFTVECWIRCASFPGSGQNRGILCHSRGSSSRGWYLYIPPTLQSVNAVFWQNDSTTIVGFGTADGTLALNTWHHLAVVRSGSVFMIFIDGVLKASASGSAACSNPAVPLDVGTLYSADGITNSYWNGYIDDVRITKGVAIYTANFTPPTAAHPDT